MAPLDHLRPQEGTALYPGQLPWVPPSEGSPRPRTISFNDPQIGLERISQCELNNARNICTRDLTKFRAVHECNRIE
jgi:hypothetical protein